MDRKRGEESNERMGGAWLRLGVALHLIPVPLGRKKDPFCSNTRKPITQKVKRIPNTDLVKATSNSAAERREESASAWQRLRNCQLPAPKPETLNPKL